MDNLIRILGSLVSHCNAVIAPGVGRIMPPPLSTTHTSTEGHVLIPRTGEWVSLQASRWGQIQGLEAGKLAWFIQLGPMQSQGLWGEAGGSNSELEM